MLFNAEKLEQLLALTPDQIKEEAAMKVRLLLFYRHIFQEQPCGGCKGTIEAYYKKLKTEGITKLLNKVERDFDFKENVCIQVESGRKDHFTNHNLTNEVAIEILKFNKKRIKLFKRFPSDWEKLIESNLVQEQPQVEDKLPEVKKPRKPKTTVKRIPKSN